MTAEPGQRDVSGYMRGYQNFRQEELPRLLERRQEAAALAEKRRRATYLGGAVSIGGIGLLGGALEAVDTMENQELAWVIAVAVFVALVLSVGCYLLWQVVRTGAENDLGSLSILDDIMARLVRAANEIYSADGDPTGKSQETRPPPG